MYQALATAVLLAATVFPPGLEGQMRAMQRPTGPVQVNVQRLRVRPRSGGFGVVSPRSFGRQASFVRPVPFRHNLHFSISFGNTCFTGPLFYPFLFEQLLFLHHFLFTQPLPLPSPLSPPPSHHSPYQ